MLLIAGYHFNHSKITKCFYKFFALIHTPKRFYLPPIFQITFGGGEDDPGDSSPDFLCGVFEEILGMGRGKVIGREKVERPEALMSEAWLARTDVIVVLTGILGPY